MNSIIFICLGNICRSSLAEGIAKAKAGELNIDISIESAGLSEYHNGESPCEVSQEIAEKNGIDISSQVSKHITRFDLNSFDLIVAMDESNLIELEALGIKNLVKLGDFGFDGEDVADLYYYPEKAEYVYDMIDRATQQIMRQVQV